MVEEGFKRKLTAILNADVEGYSRLMRDDEESTIRTLTTYREAMASLIQQYRGRVVDSPGDNLLAEFASVVDAVQCAVEIQRELAERNIELPAERKMEFRIGVNLGDVVEEGNRIYGDGVNIAARLENICEGGGICISGTAFEHVQHKLELEYEDLGEHEVKNIPTPVRVYRVLSHPGAAAHRVIRAKKAVGKKLRMAAMVIAGVLIIAVGGFAVWNFVFRAVPPSKKESSGQSSELVLTDKPSIAVLPFINMSDDPKQEYFSDGISEDLITDLSKISNLLVISRNSTFAYKGESITTKQVAEKLGARYVLEGSVRKAGDQIRINAQLIEASTDSHLWAERYDGRLSDVFALQDKITQKIVAALAVKLTKGESDHLANRGTSSINAYDMFLKGWDNLHRPSPDRTLKALSYFEKAIALDPSYGRAYAGLAQAYWLASIFGLYRQLNISWQEIRLRMRHNLLLALKNPTSLAYALNGHLIYRLERRYEEAILEVKKAISLEPNNIDINRMMASTLSAVSRPESIDYAKRMLRIDPGCVY